jgi:hypothetical protein
MGDVSEMTNEDEAMPDTTPEATPAPPAATKPKTVYVGADGKGDDGVDYGVALAGATVTLEDDGDPV